MRTQSEPHQEAIVSRNRVLSESTFGLSETQTPRSYLEVAKTGVFSDKKPTVYPINKNTKKSIALSLEAANPVGKKP